MEPAWSPQTSSEEQPLSDANLSAPTPKANGPKPGGVGANKRKPKAALASFGSGEAPIRHEGHAVDSAPVPLGRGQAGGAVGAPALRGTVIGAPAMLEPPCIASISAPANHRTFEPTLIPVVAPVPAAKQKV